jgi:hypothetical protein
MTTKRTRIPAGLYGPERDGLGDPDRPTVAERMVRSPERLAEERQRRSSPTPIVRALQRATDRALGRAGR